MSHVLQLVVLEYQQAHLLLYDELMFTARDMIPMQSWKLKDDLVVSNGTAIVGQHTSVCRIMLEPT